MPIPTISNHRESIEKWKREVHRYLEKRILIFSDMSGSSEEAKKDQEEYFKKTLCHMCDAHVILTDITEKELERFVVKTVGDEVMVTQLIPKRGANIGKLLKEVVIAVVKFKNYFRESPTKICIKLCKKVLPIEKESLLMQEINKAQNIITENAPLSPSKGDILGSDVNLAARIMGIAEAGQILISLQTYRAFPDEWKNKDTIEIDLNGKKSKIKIDLPTGFFFKGFHKEYERTEKVIQLIDINDKDVSILSESGYKHICLTNFLGSKIEVKKAIKEVFPRLNYIIFFEILKPIFPHDEDPYNDFSYPLSIIFHTRDEEDYKNLSRKLKDKTNVTTFSHTFYEPSSWRKWPILRNDMKDKRYVLCLWRCSGWLQSKQFYEEFENYIKESGAQVTSLINLLVTGFYDNFTLLCSSKRIKSRIEEELIKLLNYLHKKEILTRIYNTSLHAWEVKITYINNILKRHV